MDQVRQLRPGLPGGSLLRYRSGRSRELSLGLCLLLPVRSSKQDPGPRLVSTVAVPIVRTSGRVVAVHVTGVHPPRVALGWGGALTLGLPNVKTGPCTAGLLH